MTDTQEARKGRFMLVTRMTSGDFGDEYLEVVETYDTLGEAVEGAMSPHGNEWVIVHEVDVKSAINRVVAL